MTELMRKALEGVSALPADQQDDMARALFLLLDDEPEPVTLTAEEAASLAVSLAQAEREEYATDERVEAIWSKRGP